VLLAWAQHRERHFTCLGSAAGFDAEVALEAAMNEMETLALARLEEVPPEDITPEQVRSPADHGALHATPRYFARADALLHACGPALAFPQVALACRLEPSAFYERLRQRGHALRWVDLSLPAAGNFLAGSPLYTVRALAEGLVPMAFGAHHQPWAMAPVAPGGRFPHPFT
jgi:ribosomal protein S12 methylthiotransferase accessory factor